MTDKSRLLTLMRLIEPLLWPRFSNKQLLSVSE